MKRFFRVFLITLGVILLLLMALPLLFKSKIEETVKMKINQEILATVDWSRFTLSFFRGFPDLSVNLHQVSVVGVEPFMGDTLVGLKRFEFRINPFTLLKQEIQVKSILLDQPLINGIVLEDGSANWDIVPAESDAEIAENVEPDTGNDPAGSVSLLLQKFILKNGRVYYKDQALETDASMEGFDLELSGDFTMELTDLNVRADIKKVDVRQGGIRYLNDGTIGLEILAEANLLENRYTLKKSEMRINGLVLGAEGVVSLMEEGAMDFDIRFFSRETTFKTLLSLVPAIYLEDFESMESRGILQLEGRVQGIMKDTLMPDASLTLQVTDGYFSYPGLPEEVSDVQIKLVVDYKGTDMDATTVDLERLHLLIAGNPFDMKFKADHPVSDMHVSGEAVGTIDFASLRKVVPLEDISLEGRLESNLRWDTRMSFIELEQYDRVDLDGSFQIEHMEIKTTEIPVPVYLSNLEMKFNPRFVDLVSLDLNLGSSDLHLDGELGNFIPYLFADQTVSGKLNVVSKLLDTNELMPQDEAGEEVENEIDEAVLQDSVTLPAQLKIPQNIDFKINLQMKKVINDQIDYENISGRAQVYGGIAYIDELSFNVIGGEVSAAGQVDTRGEFTEVNVSMDMNGIDIPAAYTKFVAVERLAPMAKYCRGTANVELQYQSLLDPLFNPLYETIDAKGRMFTRGLQIYDLNTFVKLSELLKNEKFREMAPDEVNLKFTILDGRVVIDPFDMDYEASTIRVSGSHGIDLTLDYLLDMNLAKSDLGEGANSLLSGMSLLAMGAGIKIPQSDYIKVKAKITGTFNDPKIATDLSGNLKAAGENVSKAVEQRVMEEVEKAEEKMRDEASVQAEKIISDAEAEAERLIEEARKAGEALVKEAEIQGEKLVKEAGSNALKQIAAKKAAEELRRQAVKQSEKGLLEAQAQADAIIEKARKEAEKI